MYVEVPDPTGKFKNLICGVCGGKVNQIYFPETGENAFLCSKCRKRTRIQENTIVKKEKPRRGKGKTKHRKKNRVSNVSKRRHYKCNQCEAIYFNKDLIIGGICYKCIKANKLTDELDKQNDLDGTDDEYPEIDQKLINYLKEIYPYEYNNYPEILFNEYGTRFNINEAYKSPKYVIRAINKTRYKRLGKIKTVIKLVCEDCHYEFYYVYRGGPGRHKCPNCIDWTIKYPYDEKGSYGSQIMENKEPDRI